MLVSKIPSLPGSERAKKVLTQAAQVPFLTSKEDANLASIIREIEATGWAAEIYDENWRLSWVSPELQFLLGDSGDLGYGEHVFEVYERLLWQNPLADKSREKLWRSQIPYVLSDTSTPILEETLDKLDEESQNLIKEYEPKEAPSIWTVSLEFLQKDLPSLQIECMSTRLYQKNQFIGTLRIYGSGMRARVLSLAARGDERMFEKMTRLTSKGRQKVAIMFADIENSVALGRKLSAATYFELLSRISQKSDEIILEEEGIVGKHVGDGVVAYFVAENEDTSLVCKKAVLAARKLQAEVAEIKKDYPQEIKINIGLHFGGTVYMGQIMSGGRLDVTAIGDEVNECARLEALAHNGQILASKGVLDRLPEHDLLELGIDQKEEYKSAKDWNASEKEMRELGNLPFKII